MAIKTNKIVIFGAGKIGRSFISPVFNKCGYEVVFIDRDKGLIEELNKRHNYNLIIKSDTSQIVQNVSNVSGVYADKENRVAHEIANAGIVAVSVGAYNLYSVIPLIAKGLLNRFEINKEYPLDIIIAENLREGANIFRTELLKFLPDNYPVDKLVGLIETSIGKMVPIMQQKDQVNDKLQIFAEPYNTLIIDKKGFKNPIPDIPDLAPKENIKAWVDRKLCIHNLGHVSLAYAGYLYNPGFIYLWEALNIPDIKNYAKATMLQAAEILVKKYPDDFISSELEEHIDDLILRFGNKTLGDTIFRVGCDLQRKLSANDRLAGTIRYALELGLPYQKILFALVCGCHFRALDEKGNYFNDDIDFINKFNGNVPLVLKEISGFNEIYYKKLISKALIIERDLSRMDFTVLLKKVH